MKPGSVTHSFDMDQRYVGLSFTAASGSLKVSGPPNSNIAPPGYYMLFLVNKSGTPSIASWVQVQVRRHRSPTYSSIPSGYLRRATSSKGSK